MTPLAKVFLATLSLVVACSSSGEESPGNAAGGASAGGSMSGGAPSRGGESGAPATEAGGAAGATTTDGGDAGQSSGGAPSGGDSAGGESSGQAGAGGALPVKGDCGALKPAGCYRGMYVSLYTDHIGQITFAGDDLGYAFILGDEAKEQQLFDFIVAQGVDSLSLYNLQAILADEALTDALESFMTRARAAGVLRIEGIASEVTAAWDALHAFHQERAPFDGLVTEIEFWAPAGDFQVFVDSLEYVRSLTWEPPLTLSAYLGWPDAEQVKTMAPLLDRAYLHAYVSEAPQAYGYVAERVGMFDDANAELGTSVEVWPIYSAEDDDWAAGGEFFMGEWLGLNGVGQAESEFMSDWAAEAPAGLVLGGHQYYEYFFLDKYVD